MHGFGNLSSKLCGRMFKAADLVRATLDDTVCGFVRSIPVGDWRCDLHEGELRRISPVPNLRVS